MSCCRRRRQIHSLKTEQRIAWSQPRSDPGGFRLVQRQLPTTGTDKGRRQASDQLGVPLTDVRGSNSLERR